MSKIEGILTKGFKPENLNRVTMVLWLLALAILSVFMPKTGNKVMLAYIAGGGFTEVAAPRCHMKPMTFHMGEDESWWECEHCGHAKGLC